MINTSKFALEHTLLKHRTNTQNLPKSTKECPPFDFTFGQSRAVKALKTALEIRSNGYHVFAVGENGLGKRTIITELLKQRAKNEPTPNDLVYVYNFADPRHPIALSLSAGMGAEFAKDIHKLWQTLHKKLITKFNSLGYQNQLNNIKQIAQKTEMELMNSVNDIAKSHNLSLLQTQEQKAIFSPIDENIPVNQSAINKLQKELNKINVILDDLEDDINEQIDELHKSITQKISESLFKPIISKYPNKTLHSYLKNYQEDVCDNVLAIIDNDDEFLSSSLNNVPSRYFVNVLVSHQKDEGAPIVFEDMPTHPNLLGHIEYITQLGTIFTDASMIRAGALHKANGGYLLLEAGSLLEHPYAWQGLKRALQSKQIKISSLEQMLTLTGSVSLEPDSVHLDVKVILLGEPDLYYELLEFEPEFNAVFKIRADFHDTVVRNTDNEILLMSKIADMVSSMNLLPFDNTACGAILDELSRLADNKNKLALHSDRLGQILAESSRHAKLDNKRMVNKNHIAMTLNDMIERKSYLQELYWQEIKNGQQLISTDGKAVGQVNALTVISYADSEFGMPARLTALIAPNFGTGEVLDIERDVELGGSIHAKGMLIMTSYLRALFSEFHELNFSASLAFEQNYGQIDGDSATLAEACALISAISDVPIAQNIAITGSMNQLGEVQAVGGVGEKIAGFFDACMEQGLTGTQGVILPHANISSLMLRDDIVSAVAEGKFFIYAIHHLTDALAILTGMAVDDKNKNGDYKKNTLFGKAVARLSKWGEKDEEDKDTTNKGKGAKK